MKILSIIKRNEFHGYLRRLNKIAEQKFGGAPQISSSQNPILVSSAGSAYCVKYQDQLDPRKYFEVVRWMASRFKDPTAEKMITKAFQLAWEGHFGQFRESGEPYIIHPLAVAKIITEWGLGPEEIAAALCHDMREQGEIISGEIITKGFLNEQLGGRVAALVDGVTELGQEPEYAGKEVPSEIEVYKKLLKYGAKDLSVILIKLADRLHNMRTLKYMPVHKQVNKAQDTMNIYVKIADILGIWKVKRELENRAFRYVEPKKFGKLLRKFNSIRDKSQAKIDEIVENLKENLKRSGIEAFEVSREVRGLYELYERISRRKIALKDITASDIWRIHIVLPEGADCYRALGHVHQVYSRSQEKLEDYISMPRPNGHRFLHTWIKVPPFSKLLIQLRDKTMQRVNAYGVIARGSEGPDKPGAVLELISGYLESGEIRTTRELHAMIDLMSDMIWVHTRTGNRFQIRRGATVLDFAAKMQRDENGLDIFLHAQEALINDHPADISQKLRNEDQVFVKTDRKSAPQLEWIDWVGTPEASKRLREYLKEHREKGETRQIREQARNYMDARSQKHYLPIRSLLKTKYFQHFLGQKGIRSVDELLDQVSLAQVNFEKLFDEFLQDYRKLLEDPKTEKEGFGIRVISWDQPGVLHEITSKLAEQQMNIAGGDIITYPTDPQKGKDEKGTGEMELVIECLSGLAGEVQRMQIGTLIKNTAGVRKVGLLSRSETDKRQEGIKRRIKRRGKIKL